MIRRAFLRLAFVALVGSTLDIPWPKERRFDEFDEWAAHVLHEIAAGMAIPYDVLIADPERASWALLERGEVVVVGTLEEGRTLMRMVL